MHMVAGLQQRIGEGRNRREAPEARQRLRGHPLIVDVSLQRRRQRLECAPFEQERRQLKLFCRWLAGRRRHCARAPLSPCACAWAGAAGQVVGWPLDRIGVTVAVPISVQPGAGGDEDVLQQPERVAVYRRVGGMLAQR